MIRTGILKSIQTQSISRGEVSPLADDLGVGFHQIVRDVSPRQILQSVFLADLHLDTENAVG